jgi:hypothetical protein
LNNLIPITPPEKMPTQAFYSGKIALLSATPTSMSLVSKLHENLCQALYPAPEIAFAYRVLAADYLREQLQRLRTKLHTQPQLLSTIKAVLEELKLELGWTDKLYVDLPRLRAIIPGMHHIPAAAPAFSAHRDTWYANPPAQINLWIPLDDYAAEQTFVFFPDYFERAIANDSEAFEYAVWKQKVGWQSLQNSEALVYPKAQASPATQALGFKCEKGQRLLFSGSHLHQPQANLGQNIRFSLDIRLVNGHDLERGLGAKQIDNRSQGSTWSEFVELEVWS